MRNYNATYYVKSEVGLNGKPVFWAYAHYPTTEPDTPYMIFDFVENAEMFCKAMNAENNHMPYVEPVKRGRWIRGCCSECGTPVATNNAKIWLSEWDNEYCYNCGAQMDGDKE